MNKFKKIATAVVATVMAGTMVTSLAACNNGGGNTDNRTEDEKLTALLNHMSASQSLIRESTNNTGWTTAKDYWKYLSTNRSETQDLYGVRKTDGSGDINYSAYNRSSEVTLSLAIGHNNAQTSTHFSSALGTTLTLPDGATYTNSSAKPAWKAMGNELNIKWKDVYAGKQTNANLKHLVETNEGSTSLYSQTDLFTTDLAIAIEYSGKGTKILNLADYLDYMPHFKDYLESNPIVYLSLLQAGMETTGDKAGEGKTIYVAPYFDGNDDIERYCLIRQDWADKILNGSAALEGTTKFSESCGDVAVESYMGSTNYEIDCANEDGTTVKITKNYTAALAAAKDETKALGGAYKAIAGAAYTGESGNIVDIMNAALAANKDATGDLLAKLYRAYIDVCYVDEGGVHYTAETRSDVFNGYDACWDVDDLVAILRIVKTSGTSLVVSGNVVQGIVPRTGQNDRTPDMVRLAAQLYGVRGADSRYEYTYIDQAGNLQDARNDKEFYVALNNMHNLVKEGLVANYPASDGFSYNGGSMSAKDDKGEAFMMYDYAQTQTKNNYYANEGVNSSKTFAEDFNFAPVVTPVSKWDVDGDGNHNDIMRFTESWRSTKTSGLALNGALAETGNEEKLKAALQFVDYLYSADGQIVSTYGPMATNADGDGGFWYNEEATADEVTAGEYFRFKGKNYSGTEFGKKITPTVTENLYKSFLGEEVKGLDISKVSDISGGKLSFTDYARRIIGSTLPVGVKDQSFENQLTSKLAKAGADKVAKGLAVGTIKGMQVVIDEEAQGFNWWYVCVPTGMPLSSTDSNTILNNPNQDHLKYITGTQKTNKNFFSIFNYIILNGLNGTYSAQDESYTF